jgi:hypothetical protein
MLVGFLGFIGSGKGTAGEILQQSGFIPVSFAGKLKDAVACIFGWPRRLLEGDTDESRAFREAKDEYWTKVLKKTITPRLVLQWMGTEAGRNVFGVDLWVGALLRDIDPLNNYVITDVRFPNEIQMVSDSGGRLIEIARGFPPIWYTSAEAINSESCWGKIKEAEQVMPLFPSIHYSEWAWIGHPKIKVKIQNEGTLQELRNRLNKTLGIDSYS